MARFFSQPVTVSSDTGTCPSTRLVWLSPAVLRDRPRRPRSDAWSDVPVPAFLVEACAAHGTDPRSNRHSGRVSVTVTSSQRAGGWPGGRILEDVEEFETTEGEDPVIDHRTVTVNLILRVVLWLACTPGHDDLTRLAALITTR